MKLAFYLALVSLLASRPPASAQVAGPPKADSATLANRKAYEAYMAPLRAKWAREEVLITHSSPIVFFGRPQEGHGQSYTDKGGKQYYNTTLIQVVEVLRGQHLLRPGLVELIDSVPPPHLLIAVLENGPVDLDNANWGIYFCSPNSVTRNGPVYKTASQRPVQLFRNNPSAAIMSITNENGHGTFIGGVNRGFAKEEALQAYLAGLPNIVPPRKLVPERPVPPEAEAEYPRIMERIKYKWALSRADSGYIKKYIPQLMPPSRPKPVPQPSNAMSLPMEALPEFPRIMQLIRSNQTLSRADSAYIKKYIPSLMPKFQLKYPK